MSKSARKRADRAADRLCGCPAAGRAGGVARSRIRSDLDRPALWRYAGSPAGRRKEEAHRLRHAHAVQPRLRACGFAATKSGWIARCGSILSAIPSSLSSINCTNISWSSRPPCPNGPQAPRSPEIFTMPARDAGEVSTKPEVPVESQKQNGSRSLISSSASILFISGWAGVGSNHGPRSYQERALTN